MSFYSEVCECTSMYELSAPSVLSKKLLSLLAVRRSLAPGLQRTVAALRGRLPGRGRLAVLVLSLGLGAPGSAAAQPSPADQLLPNRLVPTQPPINDKAVEEAMRLVRERTGGRVLAAKKSFRRGTSGVSVRVLIEGATVVTVFVDDEGQIRGR